MMTGNSSDGDRIAEGLSCMRSRGDTEAYSGLAPLLTDRMMKLK